MTKIYKLPHVTDDQLEELGFINVKDDDVLYLYTNKDCFGSIYVYKNKEIDLVTEDYGKDYKNDNYKLYKTIAEMYKQGYIEFREED